MIFLKNENIGFAEALNISITGIIVVMIILALLAVLVVILSKLIRAMEKKTQKPEINTVKNEIKPSVTSAKANTVTLDEKQSAGQLDLYKTDEKTAAVIMAIVSDESKIPLNRLKFNSIKLIDEQGE